MYEEQRAELMKNAELAVSEHRFEDFEKIEAEIKALDEAHEKEAKAQANLRALSAAPKPVPGVMGGANSVNLSGTAAPEDIDKTDIYASTEYRMAFMNAMRTGTAVKMSNSDSVTVTGDVSAIIPTTIVRRIIEKMEITGKIWSRITKTSYTGGVAVPVSTLKPTATWTTERGTADAQKKTVSTITFSAFKLICKVALSFETTVMTLDMFEARIADNIAEAMVKALEIAAISGTGSGQPKGVLKETVPTGQNVNIAAANAVTYKDLAKAEAALPAAYENGAVWVMTKNTFINNVIGMVDGDGDPIMRELIGINGKPAYFILGREVVIVDEGYMASYADTVSSDTVFAFIFNWADYIGNTNYNVTMREYIDEDTDDRIKKALMLYDGKAVDVNSLVTLTKKKA